MWLLQADALAFVCCVQPIDEIKPMQGMYVHMGNDDLCLQGHASLDSHCTISLFV